MNKSLKALTALAIGSLVVGGAATTAFAGEHAGATHSEASKDACSGKDGCNGKDSCSGEMKGKEGCGAKGEKDSCKAKEGCHGAADKKSK